MSTQRGECLSLSPLFYLFFFIFSLRRITLRLNLIGPRRLSVLRNTKKVEKRERLGGARGKKIDASRPIGAERDRGERRLGGCVREVERSDDAMMKKKKQNGLEASRKKTWAFTRRLRARRMRIRGGASRLAPFAAGF